MSVAFSVQRPRPDAGIPLVVHVPHAGTAIPDDVRAGILLDDAALRAELVALTDWHTDALFGPPAAATGATVVVNHTSRLVVDPERLPGDREPMAHHGMGAVYTRTHRGLPLRRSDDPAANQRLVDRFLTPWAEAVDIAVGAALDRFGRCLLLDGHSFPSQPFGFEDAGLQRPDIDLGFTDFHAPRALLTRLRERVRAAGRSTADNTPFAGAYVPLPRFESDPRVQAVMVEVNRGLYLDEATAERSAGWAAAAALVSGLVAESARWVSGERAGGGA